MPVFDRKKNWSIQTFDKNSSAYPEGRVIVTDNAQRTEYTLEEWAALQNGQ